MLGHMAVSKSSTIDSKIGDLFLAKQYGCPEPWIMRKKGLFLWTMNINLKIQSTDLYYLPGFKTLTVRNKHKTWSTVFPIPVSKAN